jgi:peroxiredoxin
VSLCSADPPEESRRFKAKRGVPFRCLSDEDHRVADRFAIPIGRWHPKAWTYQDGFIQPAVFAFKGDAPIFTFIAEPRLTNLFGAAGRPSAEAILAGLEPRLGA